MDLGTLSIPFRDEWSQASLLSPLPLPPLPQTPGGDGGEGVEGCLPDSLLAATGRTARWAPL